MRFFCKNIDPHFGSGPCKKVFKFSLFNDYFYRIQDTFGRGHRGEYWVKHLKDIILEVRKTLNVPHDYKFSFIAGSCTGAMECLMWNLLGPKTVDIFSYDTFGSFWRYDIMNELKLKNIRDFHTMNGDVPDLSQYDGNNDAVFVYNGTPDGLQVPDLNWIPKDRTGLTLCDASSAVFALNMDWSKLDATAFSFQKSLGSEAGLGAIVLSPKAYKRLQEYTPEWPIPRIFRLKAKGLVLDKIFDGFIINTPSLLTLEDISRSIKHFPKNFEEVTKRNFKVLQDWVHSRTDIHFLATDPKTVSQISPCITIDKFLSRQDYIHLTKTLEKKKLAYDINGHDLAPPCLRIWCGPNVNECDLKKLVKVLDQYLP